MMKRCFAIAMACMLLLSGCGKKAGNPPDNPPKEPSVSLPAADNAQLTALRSEIHDSGALMGVAYLGYAELPYFEDVSVYLEANGFGDKYPFLYEIPEERIVRQEGGEIYVVVPASADVKLTVCEYQMDDGAAFPEPGVELLEVSDGQPLLLIGNVSEIVPNLFVRAEESGGLTADYAPCLSLEDGSLTPGEGVYDFTPTELLGQFGPGNGNMSETAFCGTWYAQHYDANDERMAMALTLDQDGWAEYYYGYVDGEILERFEGSWSLAENQQLVLDLYGGPESWDGSTVSGEQYQMQSMLHYDFHGSALILKHEGESALLYGTEEELYRFLPFNGYHLMGDWTAESDVWGWLYELRLFDNGECWFVLYSKNETLLAMYEGWWYVENDILDLSMILSDGQHPENPALDYISGSYSATLTAPDALTLKYISGDILTVNMEETGGDWFNRSSTSGGSCVSVHYAQDVNVDWSACDWVIVDDTAPVEAAFCTMVPVEDFTVVSLSLQDISDDGMELDFDVTELYEYGTLSPDRPLKVVLTIYGDVPSYGVSFTDPNGSYRLFGVTMSGEDGSLELVEIQ